MTMNTPITKTWHRQLGVAAIELALLLAPLVLLSFGITEYGRAMVGYGKICKSTRDAARYLTLYAPGDAATMGRARNLVVYGNVAGTGLPLVTGLTTGHVAIADSTTDASLYLQPTGSGNVNLVRVRVAGYRFTSAVPAVVAHLTFGPIEVTMGQVL